MSSVALDDSYTTVLCGGEEVGYQGRKKCRTANVLYFMGRQGIPLNMSSPQSREYHDTYDIGKVMQDMMDGQQG